MPKITEPDEDLVHYQAFPCADAVTLCGVTDFILSTPGKPTNKPVTCRSCKAIVDYVRSYDKPKHAAITRADRGGK